MEPVQPSRLADLLKPYNATRVAEFVGASRQSTASWARGERVPEIRFLPKLAELLRMDLAELTRLVAADEGRLPDGPSTEEVA
jgi:transcriptional regulator with XRE-family HTH domain